MNQADQNMLSKWIWANFRKTDTWASLTSKSTGELNHFCSELSVGGEMIRSKHFGQQTRIDENTSDQHESTLSKVKEIGHFRQCK